MAVHIVSENEITPEQDRNIRNSLCVCFPAESATFSTTRAWHGSAPAWSVILEENGRIAAHVGIIDRMIRAGDNRVRVAGVQNVFVLPELRGRGLCDRVMIAAMEEAAKKDFDAGLLFCVPNLERVYARCGWKLIPKTGVIRVDENGAECALPSKNIAMFHPLKLKVFPGGPVRLQGNDW